MSDTHRYAIYVNTEDRKAFKELTASFPNTGGPEELIIGHRTRFGITLSDVELLIITLSLTNVKAIKNNDEYHRPPGPNIMKIRRSFRAK